MRLSLEAHLRLAEVHGGGNSAILSQDVAFGTDLLHRPRVAFQVRPERHSGNDFCITTQGELVGNAKRN